LGLKCSQVRFLCARRCGGFIRNYTTVVIGQDGTVVSSARIGSDTVYFIAVHAARIITHKLRTCGYYVRRFFYAD
jgi:hypothetical protein